MSNESEVRQILSKVLGPGVDLESARLGAIPEWDSLASLSILMEVEEAFDVELSEDEVVGLVDLQSIIVTLDAHK